MPKEFTVTLTNIINELSLETVFMPSNPSDIKISSKDVNRPGIELTGFLDYFDNSRIIVMGNTEHSFLAKFNDKNRFIAIERILKRDPPAVVVTRNLEPYKELIKAAKMYKIPVLKSADTTSTMIASLVSYMSVELAQRETRHGVLVEVYGEGILIMGDSGIGKSETAIELIKRGHRLIADDAVEVRKVSRDSLVGAAPENIRHFIELRGIGIINARRIFGMGAVKLSQKIDMVINMELWNDSKVYDRMGVENEYINILGVNVPILTIPIKPGRNLAIIIEVAAMNNRQKKLGYNAAQELLSSLGMEYMGDIM